MSLLFRNWLDEGYYEEDCWVDLTRIEDPADILRAQKEGKLYQNDGMATTRVGEDENIDLGHGKNC
jgi:hypothetical protein